MDNENIENFRKSCKEPRIIKKTHKRSVSQDMKSRPNSLQVNGHHHHHSSLTTQALKPRITKLENLEARMASIEVSLSNALENSGARLLTRAKPANENTEDLQSPPDHGPRIETPEYTNINTADVLSSIVISNQHQQITRNQNLIRLSDQQTSKDGQTNQDCIWQNQTLIDNKAAVIKNLKLKLENLEVNDLDSRIYQAELECLLEKEEMNILNLHQEQMSLRAALNQLSFNNGNHIQETSQSPISGGAVTLYSIVSGSHCTSVLAMEVPYDAQSPCFYVTAHHSGKGLIVQWAKDNSKLKKGDRLLEVNGRLVVNWGKEEFLEVLRLSVSVKEALKIVVLRNTPMLPVRKVNSKEVETLKEEMSSVVNKLDTKIKENRELLLSVQKMQKELDNLKDENQKLHHRTFYLEDQISEMKRHRSAPSSDVTQAIVLPTKSSVRSSTTAIADAGFVAAATSAVLTTRSSTALRCAAGSVDGNRNASPSGVYRCGVQQSASSTVVKSHSVNQLDKLVVQRPSSSDHHILQVKIPFSPTEQNIGRTVSSYDVRTTTANTYINVPLPKSLLSFQAPFPTNGLGSTRWVRGRHAGADSDSGNYSGDSMDDSAQAAGSPVLAAFVLQRQRQITQGGGATTANSANATKANCVSVKTAQQAPHPNPCYVNLVEATGRQSVKRLATLNRVQFSSESQDAIHVAQRSSLQHKQSTAAVRGSYADSSRQALGSDGDPAASAAGQRAPPGDVGSADCGAVKYVNQVPHRQPYASKEKSANDIHRNLSNLQLKVNGNKIGLNDQESDNEEWC